MIKLTCKAKKKLLHPTNHIMIMAHIVKCYSSMFSRYSSIILTDHRWNMRNCVSHMPGVTPFPLATTTALRQRAAQLQGPTFEDLLSLTSLAELPQKKKSLKQSLETHALWGDEALVEGRTTELMYNEAAQGFWRKSAPHLALRDISKMILQKHHALG